MTPEERARLIGIAVRKLGCDRNYPDGWWWLPDGGMCFADDIGLTDSGIIALLEWALEQGYMIYRDDDDEGKKYAVDQPRVRAATYTSEDTLADVLLSAIGEEG